MQDKEGRGPFRPGFSQTWKSNDGPNLPPFYVEMGWTDPKQLRDKIPPGMHAGCAVDSILGILQWFDRGERRRLYRAGYLVVVFEPDLIVAETPTQVIFANHRPLSGLKGCAQP